MIDGLDTAQRSNRASAEEDPEISDKKASIQMAGISSRPVVFVFDRVMHYHRATLLAIESRLARHGIPLVVFSSKDAPGVVGRVAERGKIVSAHQRFRLWERLIAGFQIRYQIGLMDQLRPLRPAVVVSMCHSGTLTEWWMLLWAARQHVRRVAWQCGYEYSPGSHLKRLTLRRFIPLFNFHLCYHSNAKSYAITYGAREHQTLVMHNTIDESMITPAEAKSSVIEKHPELQGKKLILYVGAVLSEKRLETVFDALGMLGRTDTVFLVVGDGPHLELLKRRYAERTDWLSVGRVVEGVGGYFDASDVFVLPGTGGLAINEAMAHRLPVISGYADGSADDLVIDGVTGFRLHDGSAGELAQRLDEVLSNAERGRVMGEEGERRIRGELSFARFIDRVVDVLKTQHALAMNHS